MDSIVDEALEEVQATGATDDVSSMTADGSPLGDSGSGTSGTTDEELAEIVGKLETNITVVGCGGGGCNTLNRMVEEGIKGADMIACNTDAYHLREVNADGKLLMGKSLTKGRGAGAKPQVGEQAALENQQDIQDLVHGSDMVFVTAGMGGGTGTGSAPVVAQAAKDAGALTISVVTLPFTSEGQSRRDNAEAGVARLRKISDTLIVVPNDKLLDTVGNLPLNTAFKVADEVLMRSVKGITELITKPGMVNLDFADVSTVMQGGGVAMIGLGEASGEQRARDSVRKALRSPVLDVDIHGANSVLVNVTGGPDMTIEEAEGVVEQLYDSVDPDARIIWGAGIDPEFEDKVQTMIVVTGATSDQIYAAEETDSSGVDSGSGDIDFEV